MKAFIHKNFYNIALIITFIFAFFLRSYRLAEIPDIIHIDEAGLGYNAWSIAHYGVDRYLNEMPLYAQNFEGGQSPLYTYIVVLLISTIGKGNLTLSLLRLPGLLASMIVVIMGTKSMALIFKNKKVTLMSAILLTICPYYIMQGRFALDCNLMLACSTVALYLLAKYIETQRLIDLILCGIAFGITLYSYALSYFLLPIFLILITLYLLYIGKMTFRNGIIWAISVSITALPVILFIFSMLFQWEPFHFLGVVISPTATTRLGSFADRNFFANIAEMLHISLTHDSYTFNSLEKFNTLYFTSIPFIIIGFLYCTWTFFVHFKKRLFHYNSLYWLFFICSLVTTGLTRAHAIYRGNFYYISYLYFLVSGIYVTYQFVHSYRYAFISVLSACYLLWTLSFLGYYFSIYSVASTPKYTKMHIDTVVRALYVAPFSDAIENIKHLPNVNDIYIDCSNTEEYLHFFSPVSPYQIESKRHEEGYGPYHLNINYDTPLETHNVYIVRKENVEFISKIVLSEIPHQRTEYPHYYLYYIE